MSGSSRSERSSATRRSHTACSALSLRQFLLHRRQLLIEVLLRAQAVIAGKGIDGEIADEQRGEDIKTERGQDGAATPVGDHGRHDAAIALRRL